ncbi:hypothetical protein SERN_0939 [Serinibacter arcticus]|uniref:Uncharacterized protein n=1 Tax=Serinibacter arcticus TaxID=1655435 RepID=A0A4Z1EB97_9MICO|nr:hypothetical protein SERN_0939 [Serinibacter arcticus]
MTLRTARVAADDHRERLAGWDDDPRRRRYGRGSNDPATTW